ncbi:MAG: hypothetical protein O2U61_01290 [Candidatus Bathyarchaeota archaeon]|nr:hypothetical protein [Candidatus Bathyarchaeota archaeon]
MKHSQTLVLSRKQETVLEQIYSELLYSLKKTWTEEKIFDLSCDILKDCSQQTFVSKKDKTVNFFKATGRVSNKAFNATKNKFNRYRYIGFKSEFDADSKLLKASLESTPGKIRNFGNKTKIQFQKFNDEFLKKSRDEKIEIMASGLMGVLIFYASAGGDDFEGGIPDLDLEMGIGYHRNIVSHSIISGFIIEFLMRAGVEIINKSHKNLPELHHSFWDRSHKFINSNKNIAVGSMWAGISVHLIQDAGLMHARTKPYTGIPLEMSMDAHQGLFTANGTASAIFAKN